MTSSRSACHEVFLQYIKTYCTPVSAINGYIAGSALHQDTSLIIAILCWIPKRATLALVVSSENIVSGNCAIRENASCKRAISSCSLIIGASGAVETAHRSTISAPSAINVVILSYNGINVCSPSENDSGERLQIHTSCTIRNDEI